MIQLNDAQIDAVKHMKNGCILCGGVGSGKSRTALAYYYTQMGGKLNGEDPRMTNPKDLYIITTARKRDTLEWEAEMPPFLITTHEDQSMYHHKVVVDSWNNLGKYRNIQDSFFIFDEQRVVGYGAWAKNFILLSKHNSWILLSATPGDKWEDYIPVFIANGFYKNKTEFARNHLVYSSYTNFPKVERYLNTGRLLRLRKSILVDIDVKRETIQHHEDIYVSYDAAKYKDICKDRWNPFLDKPIENASEFCQALRKVVNSDPSREIALLEILEKNPKAIVFYNYDYELDILRALADHNGFTYAEWNGHKHQPIPDHDRWLYLVQYNAGSEGWNCVRTNVIVFYSQSYSYRTMIQAAGRIDRLNTPFNHLYYYHFKSRSGIDVAISRALKDKKKFNEGKFYGGM